MRDKVFAGVVMLLLKMPVNERLPAPVNESVNGLPAVVLPFVTLLVIVKSLVAVPRLIVNVELDNKLMVPPVMLAPVAPVPEVLSVKLPLNDNEPVPSASVAPFAVPLYIVMELIDPDKLLISNVPPE